MNDLFDTWLYKNTPDNKARFVLGERGDNPLICFGVNPSTAEPGKLDNTLRRVKSKSEDFGFDGWVMLNLYPQRATNPNELHKKCDPNLLHENFEAILNEMFEVRKKHTVVIWAAWGNLIEKRPYLKKCLSMYYTETTLKGFVWVHAGNLTTKGHPKHPLYLPKDEPLRLFNMKDYIERLTVKDGKTR